jgi:hypothetical protein
MVVECCIFVPVFANTYYQLKLKTARAPLPKSLPQGGGTLKENHNAYYDSGLMV